MAGYLEGCKHWQGPGSHNVLGPRFWHPIDISFSESCFAIQSSSPQPNGARVQNCAGIFEDVNI